MTDLEKMKNTFIELGVEFNESTVYDKGKYDAILYLDSGIGYSGFTCDFYFLRGKYVNHGVWE